MSESDTRDRLRKELVLSIHAFLGDENANCETEGLIAMKAWLCFDLPLQPYMTICTWYLGDQMDPRCRSQAGTPCNFGPVSINVLGYQPRSNCQE